MQAVLITAYKDIEQLAKLAAILSEDFEVYIHIDKRVSLSQEQRNLITGNGNEHIFLYTLYTKGLLFGKEKDVDASVMKKWKSEIKSNYKALHQGNFLDWKRKLILDWICKRIG